MNTSLILERNKERKGWLKDGVITKKKYIEENERALEGIRLKKKSKVIREVRKEQNDGEIEMHRDRSSEEISAKEIEENRKKNTYYRC
mmetsp:Transcript_36708/g.36320  ORF Transcript_36708/g.36320 Transcript_36708/m.36320 type:complete len:88 (+) Transcript_36708:111-374(+)